MFTAGYQKAFYIFEPIVSKTNANLKLIATQPPVAMAISFCRAGLAPPNYPVNFCLLSSVFGILLIIPLFSQDIGIK